MTKAPYKPPKIPMRILVGYIGRTELRYALDRAKKEQMVSPHARCIFASQGDDPRSATTPTASMPAVSFDDMAETSGQTTVDFTKFVDPTPLAVHPRLPLETVMELFKKLGPRVILVEHRGRLTGLVTVKDCLKYQFQVEAHDNPRDDHAQKEKQEKLWEVIKRAAGWVGEKTRTWSGGRLKLGDAGISPPPSAGSDGDDIHMRRQRELFGEPGPGSGSGEVELEDRRNVV